MNLQAPILFLAFAQDPARFLPKLADELRVVRDTLEQAEKQGLCKLVLRSNTVLEEIFQVFQDAERRDRIALFHFAGHGDDAGLLLERSGGGADWADARGLATFLGQQQGLQTVILNACSTVQQVQLLLDSGVPCVIATRYDIDDERAAWFSARFYRALAQGITLARAFAEAKAAVTAQWGEPERFAWEIFYKPGAEPAGEWNLPAAADDPLFGLPPIPRMDLPQKPFRHLHWFKREHAEVFFGRGKQIRELYTRVTSPDGAPLILLYGQSGVGKSSLLAAGLLPRLERDWKVFYLRREAEGLLGTLQKEFSAETQSTQSNSKETPASPRFYFSSEKNRLIVLDQAEELYTRPGPDPEGELKQLLAALQDLFAHPRPPVKLILGFRKEWLPEIEAQIKACRLPYNSVFLEALNRKGIIEAVTGPAHSERLRLQFSLSVEKNLPKRIADTLLSDPGAAIAPTLQILLTKLWQRAGEEEQPRFTVDLYTELEHEGILLSDFLDQQLDKLAQSHPAEEASGLVLDILAFHTTPLGTAAHHSLAELEQTYARQKGVLAGLLLHCKDLYLLSEAVSKQRRQEAVSRLAHDTLAPLVRKRFEESDKPGQRARRALENRAVDWQDGKTGAPLEEQNLALAEQGQSGMRVWTKDEERLLVNSRTARDRRARNRKVWRATGMAAVLLIAVLAFFGWFLKGKADEQTRIAQVKTELAEQKEREAKTETERAEREKTETQRTQSLFLADLARQQTEQGNAVNGMLLALEALPKDMNNPDRPYVFEAEQKLYEAVYAQRERLVLPHESGVVRAAFNPDGTQLVTASHDNTVRLWDVQSGRVLHTLSGHEDTVWHTVFSPDGTQLVTVSHDNAMRLWNVQSGRVLHTHTLSWHENGFNRAAFSPDVTQLATVSKYWSVVLWDVQSGQVLHTLRHEDNVNRAAFSPDGTQLVTTSDDNTAWLWDVQRGQVLHTLNGHEKAVIRATFSPNGTRLVTTSRDNTARLWNVQSGRVLHILSGHEDTVWHAAFSPDGAQLVTASWDNTVRLWDVQSGQLLHTLSGHESEVKHAAFSPDGTQLVTASDNTARLWDVQSGRILHTLSGHEDAVQHAAFSPDGTQLVTASWDNTARLWDVQSEQVLHILSGHEETVRHAAFSPDSTQLVTTSDDNTARLWDVQSGRVLHTLNGHENGVNHAAFSPDGTQLFTVSWDKIARLWDVQSGRVFHTLSTAPKGNTARLWHETDVNYAAFNPDGTQLVTASWDNTVRLWDVQSEQVLHTFSGHQGVVLHAAFNPDGTQLATASNDNTIRLWNVQSGRVFHILSGHESGVNHATFSPDGTQLFTTSENTARLWDVQSGQVLHTLSEHQNMVRHAAFSPDSTQLVAALSNDTVRLWDVQSGRVLHTLSGHKRSVNHAAFSPDSTQLVVALDDDTVWLWDVQSGRVLHTLSGHKNAVVHAAFSPDDTRLVTASEDNTARLWRIFPATQRLIDYANARLPRSLMVQQREQFFLPKDEKLRTAETLLAQGEQQAREGLLDDAIASFQQARENNPALNFHPELKARVLTAKGLLDKGAELARAGKLEQAIAVFSQVKTMNENFLFDPETKAANY
ncbi:MAG: CHAT domain-containing protein [Gammaproteobacteria bacterium]|nr:CHAT domain-containing protein [Gammaproteobacteria bacterium]